MPVYIYERIAVDGGGRGRFIELIRNRWAPFAERRHGVRLAGVWATIGSTAAWPEAALLWEMDSWDHFAAASAAQYPMEDRDPYAYELWRNALDWRSGGHNMLLEPAAFSPALAEITVAGGTGTVTYYEEVRARPGKLAEYHEALRTARRPAAEASGLRLLGAYRHALRPNVGLNLWAISGWDALGTTFAAELPFAGGEAWFARCRDLLEDSDGYLLAAPPAEALGT